MSTEKQSTKRQPGRPISETPAIKKSVSMPSETYDHLMSVGKGKLSKGVRVVTAFHKANEASNKPRKAS